MEKVQKLFDDWSAQTIENDRDGDPTPAMKAKATRLWNKLIKALQANGANVSESIYKLTNGIYDTYDPISFAMETGLSLNCDEIESLDGFDGWIEERGGDFILNLYA